ncbi:MAG: glycoside hydrolase family 3 C-terminal domain-containing protein [Armatimonadetes bacterium]|nr:glycoside hydrolase family 3 C-terminal domain-containing protein [Candidatus Hippobium faecium]
MKKYLDTDLSFEERAEALLNELTLEERISFLVSENKEIKRLNIPAYDWWNEGLHGLARSGIATVFPQSIAMAATWNTSLLNEVAQAISTEFRAKNNAHVKLGHVDKYINTNALSPNINIFRDPRWGRGHETYGECPTLTKEMGKAFVKGMQGDGKYLKTACCAKHYAVHSGPEGERQSFNSETSEKDLFETYLPAFEALVKECGVENIMSSYNALDNIPLSANKRMLTDILREKWGFDGTSLSDAGAVEHILNCFKWTETEEETAAKCLKAGLDMDLIINNGYYDKIKEALDQGLIEKSHIDRACKRVLKSRLKMGLFADDNPYTEIPYDVIACDEHKNLSLSAALESAVLLKNDGVLPLKPGQYKNIAVIGPNAHNYEVNLGNYSGTSDSMVTVFEGIRNYAKDSRVRWTLGCPIDGSQFSSCVEDKQYGFYEARIFAEMSDLIIYVGGLNSELEGEAGDASNSEAGGDRLNLELPGQQNAIIDMLCSLGKPVIVINIAGGPVALNNSQEKANAVISGLYLGEKAGEALAKILFGEVSPSGKLPYTVPASVRDLPPFRDYSMVGRTYRYMEKKPLYPFGYGLSYSEFVYSDLKTLKGEDITLSFRVKNTGDYEAKETAMAFISLPDAPCRVPIRDLCDFAKISLMPGETKDMTLTVSKNRISYVDMEGNKQDYKGKIVISVGGSLGDERSIELGKPENLVADIEI